LFSAILAASRMIEINRSLIIPSKSLSTCYTKQILGAAFLFQP
jgi:hypothetical protein